MPVTTQQKIQDAQPPPSSSPSPSPLSTTSPTLPLKPPFVVITGGSASRPCKFGTKDQKPQQKSPQMAVPLAAHVVIFQRPQRPQPKITQKQLAEKQQLAEKKKKQKPPQVQQPLQVQVQQPLQVQVRVPMPYLLTHAPHPPTPEEIVAEAAVAKRALAATARLAQLTTSKQVEQAAVLAQKHVMKDRRAMADATADRLKADQLEARRDILQKKKKTAEKLRLATAKAQRARAQAQKAEGSGSESEPEPVDDFPALKLSARGQAVADADAEAGVQIKAKAEARVQAAKAEAEAFGGAFFAGIARKGKK
jgi:hypothetical protein